MKANPIFVVTLCIAGLLLLAACRQPQSSGANAGKASNNGIAEEGALLIQKGERLYQTNCQSCHGGAAGGKMMDIPPPHNANGHTWHHPDCQLKDIILNGSGEMGEMMRQMMGARQDVPRMPIWKGVLADSDIEAILTYIKSMWTPAQRQWQARVTQAQCR